MSWCTREQLCRVGKYSTKKIGAFSDTADLDRTGLDRKRSCYTSILRRLESSARKPVSFFPEILSGKMPSHIRETMWQKIIANHNEQNPPPPPPRDAIGRECLRELPSVDKATHQTPYTILYEQ